MAKTAMTHARLTPEVKKQAEDILKELGISISTAYEESARCEGGLFDLYSQIVLTKMDYGEKAKPWRPRISRIGTNETK